MGLLWKPRSAARSPFAAFTALRQTHAADPEPPSASLLHLFDMVALCYELPAATRCDSRPAQRNRAQLAALLEAPLEKIRGPANKHERPDAGTAHARFETQNHSPARPLAFVTVCISRHHECPCCTRCLLSLLLSLVHRQLVPREPFQRCRVCRQPMHSTRYRSSNLPQLTMTAVHWL